MTVFAYAAESALLLKETEGGVRANEWVSRTLQVMTKAVSILNFIGEITFYFIIFFNAT